MSDQIDISADFRRLRACLDTLQSINAENILIPDGPQDRDHEIIEMAYTALGRRETEVDALSEELEHQHKRLDAARDAALAGSPSFRVKLVKIHTATSSRIRSRK